MEESKFWHERAVAAEAKVPEGDEAAVLREQLNAANQRILELNAKLHDASDEVEQVGPHSYGLYSHDSIQVWPMYAYVVMTYVVMGCIGMAYIVMAYVVMACIVMAYIGMAYIVVAYIVMAYIVMASQIP